MVCVRSSLTTETMRTIEYERTWCIFRGLDLLSVVYCVDFGTVL